MHIKGSVHRKHVKEACVGSTSRSAGRSPYECDTYHCPISLVELFDRKGSGVKEKEGQKERNV